MVLKAGGYGPDLGTVYGAEGGWLRTALITVPISSPAISLSLDPKKNLVGKRPASCHPWLQPRVQIYSILGYKY